MNILRQTAKTALAQILPSRVLLTRGSRQAGIALTFDDGPHPDYTPRLLDVLRQHDITVTFFVVGREVERWPEIVRRIAAEGHVLGHHSYSHSEPSQTSTTTLMNEIDRTQRVFDDVVDAPVRFFRPPKGKLTPGKLWGLRRRGLTTVLWNADPRDYTLRAAGPLIDWCRSYQPAGGDIVLMHDNHPHCLEALPHLVEQVRRCPNGRFETVADWIAAPAARTRPFAGSTVH